VIEGLIKQLEDRKAILEQELLDRDWKRERLRVQIWLTKDEIEKASAGKNADLRAKLTKNKEEQDRLLDTYESELTARRFALESDKNRLKSLQRQLEAEREMARDRENELRKTVNKPGDQNAALRAEIASERTGTARQQQQLERLEKRLEALEAELRALREATGKSAQPE
jgi:chromosome segregation ATPase